MECSWITCLSYPGLLRTFHPLLRISHSQLLHKPDNQDRYDLDDNDECKYWPGTVFSLERWDEDAGYGDGLLDGRGWWWRESENNGRESFEGSSFLLFDMGVLEIFVAHGGGR